MGPRDLIAAAPDAPGDEALDAARPRRGATTETLRLGLIVLAVVVVGRLVVRLEETLGLVLLAATLAFITEPVRCRLTGRLGRAAGVALTAFLTYATIVALAAVLWRDLSGQSMRLAEVLGGRIDDLRSGSIPARIAESVRARDGIDAVFERLPITMITGRDSAPGVGTQAVQLLVAVILAAFLQSGVGAMTTRVVARWERDDREHVRRLWSDVVRRSGSLVRRSLAMAAATAAVAIAAAALLDVPGAIVLGMWAGVWLAVPTVGAIVGLTPLVVAAVATGPVEGAAMLVVAVALGSVGHVVRARIVERHLAMLGSMWLLAIGVGTSIAGPGGALVVVTGAALTMAWLTKRDALPPTAPSNTDTWLVRVVGERLQFVPTWTSLVAVLGGVAAVALLWVAVGQLARAAVWMIVATMVAVALNRPIAFVARRLHLSRLTAVGLVLTMCAIALTAVITIGVSGASSSTSEFSSRLPTIVQDMEEAPLVGGWLRYRDAAAWVDTQLEQLPDQLSSSRVANWLPVVGNRVVDLLWTLLLIVALLVDGSRLAAGARRRVPATHRRQFARMTEVGLGAVSAYLAGAMLVAGINATVVLTVALALGLGLAPVLAAWAFVWNFVPQIGGFMGGFPLVLLALGVGPAQALLAAVIYIGYQFIENNVIQPTIIGEPIDIPPWATLLAALAGAAAAGLIGAIVLTPLVGVVKVTREAYRREDFPGRVAEQVGVGDSEPEREPEPDSEADPQLGPEPEPGPELGPAPGPAPLPT
jgi:predicted PurR-regulated permease PerM